LALHETFAAHEDVDVLDYATLGVVHLRCDFGQQVDYDLGDVTLASLLPTSPRRPKHPSQFALVHVLRGVAGAAVWAVYLFHCLVTFAVSGKIDIFGWILSDFLPHRDGLPPLTDFLEEVGTSARREEQVEPVIASHLHENDQPLGDVLAIRDCFDMLP
jgi:hypothetical protein